MTGPASAVRAAGGAWRRFWFDPVPGSTFALWRSAYGFTVAVWFLSFLPDLRAFFSEDGLMPRPVYGPWRFGLFQWFESDTALYLVYAAGLVSALAVMVGRLVRVAAPVSFMAVLSLQLDNTALLNAGDELLRIWGAYLALFAILTPGRLLDVPLFGTPGDDGERRWAPVPPWLVRLAQLQLTIVYPFSVLAKWEGETWRDGTAALWSLGLEDFERFPVPGFVERSLVLGALITWGTLLVEALVPLLLWFKRSRRAAIVAGLVLHVSFDYALRVGFFGWAMILGYVAFLTPGESARILGWFGRRVLVRGGAPPAGPAQTTPGASPEPVASGR